MKIILTGSLGHIGLPLTTELVQRGHAVTVISSKPENKGKIEALGATAAIGKLEDVDFLTATFTGADAVYCMVPPNNYFDHNLDLLAFYKQVAGNYAEAIKASGVKRAVYLSSIGADLEKDSGIILGHHAGEAIMSTLTDVAITFLRPTSFYYNLYGFTAMIKNTGVIAANYGADDLIPWVSPNDIAAVTVEELETPLTGKKVRYIASEEATGSQTASILGAAIGKPDLKWEIIPSEQVLGGLVGVGMNPKIAAGLVEMYANLHSGVFSQHYFANRPTVMGKVKLVDFAKEFAQVYHQK
jgi:uncharacterized protein YbjT (DUF2867 family)